MMLSMTCHNLEFGRTRLDFVACGCSSNASFDRFYVRNFSKGVLRNGDGCKARKSLCHRREIGPCRVFSTKTPEVFLDGIAAGPPPVLDLTKELTKLSSISDLFEVVANDLQMLNKNLKSEAIDQTWSQHASTGRSDSEEYFDRYTPGGFNDLRPSRSTIAWLSKFIVLCD